MMTVLRQKLFRRDELPNNLFWPVSEELIKKYGSPIIQINSVKKYDKQINELLIGDKNTIKKIRSDLKKGYLYVDGPAGGDTHYLSDHSKKDQHVLSKKINEIDRLNYRVYKPDLEEMNEEERIVIKVILESCKGHELNGTPNYINNL